MSQNITTPVGRLVEGNLYRGNDRDINGQLKTFKKGPNAGQPRVDYYFALAIPKGNETHWNQTPWGQIIWTVAKTDFPQGQSDRPDFSWKITDGDSTVLNKAKPPYRPCDKEGFAGNWVLKFSRPFPCKIYNETGSYELTKENYVNLGDYVQVLVLVKGNESDQQSGVYLNPLVVAFRAYGKRIISGPDPKSVGFGQAPLPPGASTTPPDMLPIGVPLTAGQGISSLTPPVASPPPYPQILNVPPAPNAPAQSERHYVRAIQASWMD